MASFTELVSAGMTTQDETSDTSSPAAEPQEVQGSEATTAVGDDALAEVKPDAPVAKEPAAPEKPLGDIDISKVDLSKLSPEVRTLVEGYRKSFQSDYSRKMNELKAKEDALQATTTTTEKKLEAPTFDDTSLESLDGDVAHGPLKQLSAMTKYQDARITELSDRATRAETMATKITEMYLDDTFSRQYDQLTGPGGQYESTPLDRAVVMEIIKTSSDERLGIGPDMVRNAFKTILGPGVEAKAAEAKSAAAAKKHALPTGGGVAGAAMQTGWRAKATQALGKFSFGNNQNVGRRIEVSL